MWGLLSFSSLYGITVLSWIRSLGSGSWNPFLGKTSIATSLSWRTTAAVQCISCQQQVKGFGRHWSGQLRQGHLQSQNHSVVWVGKDLKDHLVQAPFHVQGHRAPSNLALSSARDGAATAYPVSCGLWGVCGVCVSAPVCAMETTLTFSKAFSALTLALA